MLKVFLLKAATVLRKVPPTVWFILAAGVALFLAAGQIKDMVEDSFNEGKKAGIREERLSWQPFLRSCREQSSAIERMGRTAKSSSDKAKKENKRIDAKEKSLKPVIRELREIARSEPAPQSCRVPDNLQSIAEKVL